MGRLDGNHEAPHCPVCDGPCTEEFPRSEFRFPDNLPRAKDGSADPEPEKPPKVNRKGRRMLRPEHHAPDEPAEDRMVRPSDDR